MIGRCPLPPFLGDGLRAIADNGNGRTGETLASTWLVNRRGDLPGKCRCGVAQMAGLVARLAGGMASQSFSHANGGGRLRQWRLEPGRGVVAQFDQSRERRSYQLADLRARPGTVKA